MGIGVTEVLVIIAVALLLFGSTRVPQLARSLGQASKEFRAGLREARHHGDSRGPTDDRR